MSNTELTDRAARLLACMVIFSACRDLRMDKDGADRFFQSVDYRFYADIAGIHADGVSVMKAVQEKGINDTRFFGDLIEGEMRKWSS